MNFMKISSTVLVISMLLLGSISKTVCGADAPAASTGKEVPVNLDSLDALKKPALKAGEEVEVNLDELTDTAPTGASGEESINLDDIESDEEATESYLPVNTSSIEKESNPLFVLTILGVILPVAAMLFTPRRKKQAPPK